MSIYPQSAVTTGLEAPIGLDERGPLEAGLEILIREHDVRTGLYLAFVDGRRLWLHPDEFEFALVATQEPMRDEEEAADLGLLPLWTVRRAGKCVWAGPAKSSSEAIDFARVTMAREVA